MTSSNVARTLLRDLSYCGPMPASQAAPEFTFDVDFDPTVVWPDLLFDTSSPLAHYPPEARKEVLQIIRDTARLTSRAPKALAFINEHMKTALACRSDDMDGASSASNRDLVGFCVLTNVHGATNRVLLCAEALLHESIHQYLYKTELARGNFCDLSEQRTYRSPWSGNRIPLHSLVHACFVWYGLLTLWCQLAQDAASAEEALHIRDRAATVLFGFAFVRQIVDSPAFPATSVEASVIQLIDHIAQSTVDSPNDEPLTLHDSLRQSEEGGWIPKLAASLDRIERTWPHATAHQ